MRQLLIAGVPGSGKSTFIAALRHLLVAGEVATELELTSLTENESHLNRLEGVWLACETVPRTKPSSEGWVQFNVRHTATGVNSILNIPDLRGEAFEQPACIGQCRRDLYDALMQTEGLLLFTNADRPDDSLLIDELDEILGGLDEDTVDGGVHSFKAENMPEEVKIVELLQVANRRPAEEKLRRLAVIISAWDLVENEYDSPEAWLAQKRPMLDQFLATNGGLWTVRVYGVSAQGGRLPEDRAELEKVPQPSLRIKIVGTAVGTHDLSAPLRWLMLQDGD